MNNSKQAFAFETLYFLLIFAFSTIETTVWHFAFPSIVLPSVWFTIVAYFAVFRSPLRFYIYTIPITLIISSFSVAPTTPVILSFCLSGVMLSLLQTQMYVKDRTHFSYSAALGFFVFKFWLQIFTGGLSWYVTLNTAISCVFIFFFSMLSFSMLRSLDLTSNDDGQMEQIELIL